MTQTLLTPPLSLNQNQWRSALWSDFIAYCEDPNLENLKIYFDRGELLVYMSNEGITHATYNHFFSMIFYAWFIQKGQTEFQLAGGCVIEKPGTKGASPDQILYIGSNAPRYTEGSSRRINLNIWRVPDLVGEISDTTLSIDLDRKLQLYADLGIPEYWVVDTQNQQVIAFRLSTEGDYQPCQISQALTGLPISLLNTALAQLGTQPNGAVALWFSQQIIDL